MSVLKDKGAPHKPKTVVMSKNIAAVRQLCRLTPLGKFVTGKFYTKTLILKAVK